MLAADSLQSGVILTFIIPLHFLDKLAGYSVCLTFG